MGHLLSDHLTGCLFLLVPLVVLVLTDLQKRMNLRMLRVFLLILPTRFVLALNKLLDR